MTPKVSPVSLHFFQTIALRLSQILLVQGHSSYVYFSHALFCPFARNFCSLVFRPLPSQGYPRCGLSHNLCEWNNELDFFFLSACDNGRKDVQMLPVPKKFPHWVTRKLWCRAWRFSTRPERMILKPCTITSPHCFLFFILYVQRNHRKMQFRFMLCLWWAPTRVIF